MTTCGWAVLWFIKILAPEETFSRRPFSYSLAVTEGTNFYYRISSQNYIVTQNTIKNTLLYRLPPNTKTQFREPTV